MAVTAEVMVKNDVGGSVFGGSMNRLTALSLEDRR